MIEQKWNDNWKFWVEKDSFSLVWNIPEQAKNITVPHDAMIEKKANQESLNQGNTGFRDGEIYNYVKFLYAPEEYREKTLLLKFEGIYMNAFVYVNEQLAAKNPFGYTTFYVPLNDFLRYGQENEIRIQVRNGAMTNSRWYSGGGIYRDVYLLVSGLTYIVPEGVQITTESVDKEYAVVTIVTELKTRQYTPVKLLLETILQDDAGNLVAEDKIPVILFEQEERRLKQRVCVEKPKLWSEETPICYTCISRIYKEEEMIEEGKNIFGIRMIQIDAKRGFCVNGKSVKLRGACIHHDSGLLGAATYEEAQFRQVKKLKEAGFNAIRMSHHPMADAMLRACDRLGMYVMDEAFDMWNRCKSNYDYGLYFQEWWKKDITAMVRKDYNHPSVVLYSIGNEIPEIGTEHGAKIAYELCHHIKELDYTRFTLASINGVFAAGDKVNEIVADVVADLSKAGEIDGNVNDFMTLMDGHLDDIVTHPIITKRLELACASTDIAGYNYMSARYEMDRETYPNRIIVGSETYPPEIARNWELVKRFSHVIGDFTWTGWDYIGEAGVGVPAYEWGEGGFGAKFPCQLAYCGDIDITGFRRPVSYFREIVFGLRTQPYIAVQNPHQYGKTLIKTPWVLSDAISSWTWRGMEGKPVIIEVYAPGTEVELYINNTLIGKQKSGKEVGYRVLFETIYQPGTVMAIAYENGIEIGKMELETAGNQEKLLIEMETIQTSEKIEPQLLYIPIKLCDEKGTVITDRDKTITLYVKEGAALVGFGSGNPKPKYNFNESITKTWNGRALAILKRTDKSNKIILEATIDNGEKIQKKFFLNEE